MRYAMRRLTIRISDELRGELDELCRQERRSLSDVVRDAIRRYLAVEKFRALRRKTLPLAEAQGLLTNEDVFKRLPH